MIILVSDFCTNQRIIRIYLIQKRITRRSLRTMVSHFKHFCIKICTRLKDLFFNLLLSITSHNDIHVSKGDFHHYRIIVEVFVIRLCNRSNDFHLCLAKSILMANFGVLHIIFTTTKFSHELGIPVRGNLAFCYLRNNNCSDIKASKNCIHAAHVVLMRMSSNKIINSCYPFAFKIRNYILSRRPRSTIDNCYFPFLFKQKGICLSYINHCHQEFP